MESYQLQNMTCKDLQKTFNGRPRDIGGNLVETLGGMQVGPTFHFILRQISRISEDIQRQSGMQMARPNF